MSVHYVSALLLVCLEVSSARSLIPSVLLLWFTNNYVFEVFVCA